jgi:transposase InsO family protein
VRTA